MEHEDAKREEAKNATFSHKFKMANLTTAKDHLHCGKSELDYSPPKLLQSDIEYEYFADLTPKNTIIPGNPLLFEIEGSSDFVDLSRTALSVQIKLTDTDGGDITAESKCAPVNNVLHSLFSQVTVTMRDSVISHPNNNYSYRAYIENLLNYSSASKETWMKNFGFHQDEAGKFDLESNGALAARGKKLIEGGILALKGRLHTDINFQSRLIPSNLDIKFSLSPSKPDFFVQSFDTGKSYRVEIVSASLRVRKVKLFPARQISFENQIRKSPIKIPITHVQMKTCSIPQGLNSFSRDGLFSGVLPKLVICGLVDNRAYTGNYRSTPFNFKHFDVNSFQLNVNGRSVPTQALTPDYERDSFIDAYETLYTSLGLQFADFDNGITPELYKNGCTLYAFNLGSDSYCPHDDAVVTGTVDLNMRFKNPLPNTVSLILYSQFDGLITIDSYRNVLIDTAS